MAKSSQHYPRGEAKSGSFKDRNPANDRDESKFVPTEKMPVRLHAQLAGDPTLSDYAKAATENWFPGSKSAPKQESKTTPAKAAPKSEPKTAERQPPARVEKALKDAGAF